MCLYNLFGKMREQNRKKSLGRKGAGPRVPQTNSGPDPPARGRCRTKGAPQISREKVCLTKECRGHWGGTWAKVK